MNAHAIWLLYFPLSIALFCTLPLPFITVSAAIREFKLKDWMGVYVLSVLTAAAVFLIGIVVALMYVIA